jgi:hypothetical protein
MSHLRPSFKPVFGDSNVDEVAIGQIAVMIGAKSVYLEDKEPWPICSTYSNPLVPLV